MNPNKVKIQEGGYPDFHRSDIGLLAKIQVRAKGTRWQGMGLILHGLILATMSKHILEIGTFRGYTAICMALALPDGGKVWTIDAKPKRIELYARKEIERFGLQDKIECVIGRSEDIEWNRSIDFLYIDGNHAYESVKADYLKFSPFMRESGVIVFHDSSKTAQHRNVRNMIEDVVEKECNCVHIEPKAGLSICQKKSQEEKNDAVI